MKAGQRVAFVGGLCGIMAGLRNGAVGTLLRPDETELATNSWFVEWDEATEKARRDSWCATCLRVIDEDGPGQSLEEFAKNIGWKPPTKETA